jgi:hypothetical protein
MGTGFRASTAIAFAQSIELPPPTAMTKSAPCSRSARRPSATLDVVGSGLHPIEYPDRQAASQQAPFDPRKTVLGRKPTIGDHQRPQGACPSHLVWQSGYHPAAHQDARRRAIFPALLPFVLPPFGWRRWPRHRRRGSAKLTRRVYAHEFLPQGLIPGVAGCKRQDRFGTQERRPETFYPRRGSPGRIEQRPIPARHRRRRRPAFRLREKGALHTRGSADYAQNRSNPGWTE